MEKNLQQYADIIKDNVNKNFKTITSIVYKYDVRKIIEGFNNLSKKDLDKLLEVCINDSLTKIKSYKLNLEQFKKVNSDIDEIIDFYTEDDTEEIMEEADYVADDLIMKVSGHNNRKLKLPISLDFIKTFCIHNMVKEKDIDLTILYIYLHLSCVCYCLDHNKYN